MVHEHGKSLVVANGFMQRLIEVPLGHFSDQLGGNQFAHELSQTLEREIAAEMKHFAINDAHDGRNRADSEVFDQFAVPGGVQMTGANADVLELLFKRVPEAFDGDARVAEFRIRVDKEWLLMAVGKYCFFKEP